MKIRWRRARKSLPRRAGPSHVRSRTFGSGTALPRVYPPARWRRAVRGRFTMSRCMLGRTGANRSFLVVETQKGPSMRYVDSTLGGLFKPINRRQFQAIVDRHDGDAYDKSFKSWDHLVAL